MADLYLLELCLAVLISKLERSLVKGAREDVFWMFVKHVLNIRQSTRIYGDQDYEKSAL